MMKFGLDLGLRIPAIDIDIKYLFIFLMCFLVGENRDNTCQKGIVSSKT